MPLPASPDRKKQLQEFLQKSQERRGELKDSLAEKAAIRQEIQQKQVAHAKQEIAKEDAGELQKKEAMKEWKVQQKEQKKEIAEMIAKKEAEQEELKQRREAEAKRVKQQKEYMRTLRWSRAMQAAKERRKKIAKQERDDMVKKAEHTFRVGTEETTAAYKEKSRDIIQEAKGDREGTIGKEEQLLHQIAVDTKEAKAKLFKKEVTEQEAWQRQIEQKKSILRRIKDTLLRKRTEQEIERTEQQLQTKHTKKYNKLRSDLEVQHQTRIAEVKKRFKQEREVMSADEREELEAAHLEAWEKKTELNHEFSAIHEQANKREKEVLTMDLGEAFGLEIEEVGDED